MSEKDNDVLILSQRASAKPRRVGCGPRTLMVLATLDAGGVISALALLTSAEKPQNRVRIPDAKSSDVGGMQNYGLGTITPESLERMKETVRQVQQLPNAYPFRRDEDLTRLAKPNPETREPS